MMKDVITGKPQLNRQINASLVFDLIRRKGPLSRAQLSALTNLRPPSVSSIVEQLLRERRIHEIGTGPSSGGRSPILLEVDPKGASVVGIEITERFVQGALANLKGEEEASLSTPLRSTKPAAVIQTIATLVKNLIRKANVAQNDVASIGVAVPGLLNPRDGAVELSVPLDWKNVALRDQLEDKTGLKVHIVNNAIAATLAEHFEGQGQGMRNILFFLVHFQDVRDSHFVNMGCGIILDGRPYFGEKHTAGEIPTRINHPLARLKSSGRKLTLQALVQAGVQKDAFAVKLWDAFAADLSSVIAYGIDFLSPGRVIVGSDLPELETLVKTSLLHSVRNTTVSTKADSVEIFFSNLGSKAILRGAIIRALETISTMPMLLSPLT